MPDFSRYLPLSQRAVADERALSTDRTTAMIEIVRAAEHAWAHAEPGTAAATAWTSFLAASGLRGTAPDEIVADLRSRAHRTPALLRVGTAFARADQEATAAGHPPAPLRAERWGMLSLLASAHLDFDRRAVVNGFTLAPDDAEWRIGHGPERTGSAREIAAFLLGVSDVAPRRR